MNIAAWLILVFGALMSCYGAAAMVFPWLKLEQIAAWPGFLRHVFVIVVCPVALVTVKTMTAYAIIMLTCGVAYLACGFGLLAKAPGTGRVIRLLSLGTIFFMLCVFSVYFLPRMHLRPFRMIFLDNLVLPVFVPVVLFSSACLFYFNVRRGE